MARPKSKNELVEAANTNFSKLFDLIDSMTDEGKNADFHFDKEFLDKQKAAHWKRDKNVRDILIHLYEWHQLLLNWVKNNQKGIVKTFLPEPYNWKTYPQMNVAFWEKHQSTSYEKARKLLEDSHLEVMDLINSFSDEELFTKKYFPWTGSTSLGSYCISSTASQYDWAMKKVRKHIKTLR